MADEHFESKLKQLHEAGQSELLISLALQHYGPELSRFSCSLMKDKNDADEALSESILSIWNGLQNFAWKSSFRTWAYTVVRNTCMDCLETRKRWRCGQGRKDAYSYQQVAEDRTQTRPYLRTEIKDKARELRKYLSTDDQILLTLRIDRKMAWREIAIVLIGEQDFDDLRIKRTSVLCRKHFERLKRRLRRLVEQEGILSRVESRERTYSMCS